MAVLRTLAPVCVLVLGMILGQPAHAQFAQGMREIEVVANDYSFQPLPEKIEAGPAIFAFANRGKVEHEVSIGRLKAGVALDDVVKAFKEGAPTLDFFARSVGILDAGPGKSPDGRLLVELVPGSTYFVFCNLKDKPDAPSHMVLGMYTAFHVE
jgi:hypothetical protein